MTTSRPCCAHGIDPLSIGDPASAYVPALTDQSTDAGESTACRNGSAIAGSGAIACGLAATAARHGDVLLWARSRGARRARARDRREGLRPPQRRGQRRARARSSPTSTRSAGATFVVEAVAEDHDAKAALLARPRRRVAGPDAILATTTSSLSVGRSGRGGRRARALRRPARLQPRAADGARRAGLPARGATDDDARARARALRRRSARPPSRSPTSRASSSTGCCSPTCSAPSTCSRRPAWSAEAIDTCMTLGAGHPMGPLALLDFVGLDVAAAIGETIGRRRAPSACARSSPRARWAARAAAASTTTDARRTRRSDPPMRVLRIPFSTNVERVALAAAHKGLRGRVGRRRPGGPLARCARSAARSSCPVLETDDGQVIADSTAILVLARGGARPSRRCGRRTRRGAPRPTSRRVVQPRLEGGRPTRSPTSVGRRRSRHAAGAARLACERFEALLARARLPARRRARASPTSARSRS